MTETVIADIKKDIDLNEVNPEIEEDDNDTNYDNIVEIGDFQSTDSYSITENGNSETLYQLTEEMTDEINSLSNRLEKQFKNKKSEIINNTKKEKPKLRIIEILSKYHMGSVSAALSLVFMGFAFIFGLFSSNGIVSAFRLSPVILIILGLEMLFNAVFKKPRRFNVTLFDFILSAFLILITFILSLCFIGFSNSELQLEKITKRLEGEMNAALTEEIIQFNKSKSDDDVTIGNIETEITLYGEDLYSYNNINNIQISDSVDLKIYFNTAQKDISKFATDCVTVMDILNKTDFLINNIEFISRELGSYIHIKLNAKLQSDIKVNEIIRLSEYYVDNAEADDLIYEFGNE